MGDCAVEINTDREWQNYRRRTNEVVNELRRMSEELGFGFGIPLGLADTTLPDIKTASSELSDIIQFRQKEKPAIERKEESVQRPGDIHAPVIKDESVRCWGVSRPWRGQTGSVVVFQDKETGKYKKVFLPGPSDARKRALFILGTFNKLRVFVVPEAEEKARTKLESELTPIQIHCLKMTDMFVEKGKSGVYYLLRRNRPTIAFRERDDGSTNYLCTLCLHPLGYYDRTWAGLMPPSDDLRVQLLMIRAKEHFYWRKAGQHPIDDYLSGV